jgi:3-methylcrotonyl-CoA carboxylase alpha subunit
LDAFDLTVHTSREPYAAAMHPHRGGAHSDRQTWTHAVLVESASVVPGTPHTAPRAELVCVVDGRRTRATVVVADSPTGRTVHVFSDEALPEPHYAFRRPPIDFGSLAGGSTGGDVVAPMAGKIASVLVSPGDAVEEGAALITLQAMKMEHVVNAAGPGIVQEVHYAVGDFVEDKAVLVSFKQEDSAADDKKAKKNKRAK